MAQAVAPWLTEAGRGIKIQIQIDFYVLRKKYIGRVVYKIKIHKKA